jgi:hypothetical protein
MLADSLSLSGAPFFVQKEGTQVLRMRKSLKMRRRSLSRSEECLAGLNLSGANAEGKLGKIASILKKGRGDS